MRLFILSVTFLYSCTSLKVSELPTTFGKPSANPIMGADSSFYFKDPVSHKQVAWQKADVFNPAAIVWRGKVYMLYRAEDNKAAEIGGRTSRLGLAESVDGIHFNKYPEPVLFPTSDSDSVIDFPGGCEDPRIAQTADGLFVIAYTSWNGKVARLSIAFSRDLVHWQKKGAAFSNAYNGKFKNSWSKSGSMITELKNGKQRLATIKGKYWMYWGEQLINLAWSDNLSDWNPLLNSDGSLLSLAAPRPFKFDSNLTECGPPAIITKKGVELFYNGKNSNEEKSDSALPRGTYSIGKIIFDKNDLQSVVYRSDTSFLKPGLPHEVTGQYKAGTTFAEALVYFHDKWFLYYGTADSYVGVAISQ